MFRLVLVEGERGGGGGKETPRAIKNTTMCPRGRVRATIF